MSIIRSTTPRLYGRAALINATSFEPTRGPPKVYREGIAKKVENHILDIIPKNPYGLPETAKAFNRNIYFPELKQNDPMLLKKPYRKPKRKKRRTHCVQDPEKRTTDLWGKPLKPYRDIQPPCIDQQSTRVNWRRFRPLGTFRMYHYEDYYPEQKQ